MQIRDLGDGSIEIIETVKEINDRSISEGLPPPIIIISCPPWGELAINTRMTKTEAKERGILK